MSDIPPNAIRWTHDESNEVDGGFDAAFDHDWRPNPHGNDRCAACGMYTGAWVGDPCPAKARLVTYWLPIEAPPTFNPTPKETNT